MVNTSAQPVLDVPQPTSERSHTPREEARAGLLGALQEMAGARARAEQDAEAVQQWSAILASEVRAYRRQRLRERLWKAIKLVLMVAAVYAMIRHKGGSWWWLFVIGGGSAAVDTRGARRRLEAASELERLQDVRAVSPLAQASRSDDAATRDVAVRALMRMLPRLTATDARHVTPDGMAALTAWLEWRADNLQLRRTVLRAMRQIGDKRTVPAVQRLCEPPAPVRLVMRLADPGLRTDLGEAVETIRAEAQETLRYLEQRAEHERLRTTLLRPATSPEEAGAILVRPAPPRASVTPDRQLVRPASPEA